MRAIFARDLEALYRLFEERDAKINSLYALLQNEAKNPSDTRNENLATFYDILEKIDLAPTSENLLALGTRLINLQEGALLQVLKRAQKSEAEIIEIKKCVLLWVSNFHTNTHKELLQNMEDSELLTPFYRALLRGIHEVGIAMNKLYFAWQFELIDGINASLMRDFDNNEAKILEVLQSANESTQSDRSYSIPKKDATGVYSAVPYSMAFKHEIDNITYKLSRLIKELENEGDGVYGAKSAYVRYFSAIRSAFLESDSSMLLQRWQDVDRAWMDIKTPLQPGHPLEYYEDRFRKAVAPEWDLRLSRVNNQNALPIKEQMKACFINYMDRLDSSHEFRQIRDFTLASIERTQLYIGIPALYYGAEMGGLFSAQVVPNDECVSKELGKKIFAFPDRVLESSRHRPFMKLNDEIFPQDFLEFSHEILFKRETEWHHLYEISTIGHEFGHIFFIDEDSELVMNSKGQFKNLEEFKATSGGIVNFFIHEIPTLRKAFMMDIIKRAVGLVAWMEQNEVMPYYCEGLIHLDLLFESETIFFDGEKLRIALDETHYENLKSLYIKTYENLAIHYLAKRESGEFLARYMERDSSYKFKPINRRVREFVEYYWNRYQEIGQIVSELDSNEHWLKGYS